MSQAGLPNGCMFTGHRRVPQRHVQALYERMYFLINHYYTKEGCRDFYAGGAMGFDRMAGAAVIEYRRTHPDVKLHLLLPCRDQAARWNAFETQAYQDQLKAADSVTYLADRYYDGCMQERNKALVNHARFCIAYCTEQYGGTVQTVGLAKGAGLRVHNIGEGLK